MMKVLITKKVDPEVLIKVTREHLSNKSLCNEMWKRVRYAVEPKFKSVILKRANLNSDELDEIFQLALVTFYENIINGKLQKLTVSPETYLIAIGKYKSNEYLRKRGKQEPFENQELLDNSLNEDEEHYQLREHRLDMLTKCFKTLSDDCKKLLSLFYFENKSFEDIMDVMDFKGNGAARTAKYRCFKKLQNCVRNG